MDLSGQRREYETIGLDEGDLDPDPFVQFARWMEEAQRSGTAEPTAAVLATADGHGRPSARTVLVKGISDGGFVVFTNYDSRKGREVAVNPWAALTFVWLELSRQVRIEGPIEPVSADESDRYFASRPRASRIGAWASPQSHALADRAELVARVAEVEDRYADVAEIPRPPHWGGLRLVPVEVELWQGRASRLHDRLVYVPAPEEPMPAPGSHERVGRWRVERRAP